MVELATHRRYGHQIEVEFVRDHQTITKGGHLRTLQDRVLVWNASKICRCGRVIAEGARKLPRTSILDGPMSNEVMI